MTYQWNERTQKWTEERLATVAAVDVWIADLKSDWKPRGWYLRDWAGMAPHLIYVEEALKQDRTTRRAVVTMPYGIQANGYWPCLNLTQFMIRDDRLIGFFYWRSSSVAEREEDNKFMRWILYQVAFSLENIKRGTIIAFRASDHEVLAGLPVTMGGS